MSVNSDTSFDPPSLTSTLPCATDPTKRQDHNRLSVDLHCCTLLKQRCVDHVPVVRKQAQYLAHEETAAETQTPPQTQQTEVIEEERHIVPLQRPKWKSQPHDVPSVWFVAARKGSTNNSNNNNVSWQKKNRSSGTPGWKWNSTAHMQQMCIR